MPTSEIVAIIALILSCLLLIKILSLQSQLNSIKTDLEWLRNRPEASSLSQPSITAASSALDATHTGSDLDGKLLMMLESGKKIQAIKVLREARSMSLLDAKNYVERLEQNL